jgi:hypothetical protein
MVHECKQAVSFVKEIVGSVGLCIEVERISGVNELPQTVSLISCALLREKYNIAWTLWESSSSVTI